MKTKKFTVYLAGAMEAASDLGEGWRSEITPFLKELDMEPLNPCEFEPQQLKGLRPNRLPEYDTQLGKQVKITHWHQLKNSDDPARYARFVKYMKRIISYDIGVVKYHSNIVVVLWDEATAKGAGTHAELTAAFLHNVPVYAVAKCDMPAWSKACCTEIFLTMDELKEFLKNEFSDGEIT